MWPNKHSPYKPLPGRQSSASLEAPLEAILQLYKEQNQKKKSTHKTQLLNKDCVQDTIYENKEAFFSSSSQFPS